MRKFSVLLAIVSCLIINQALLDAQPEPKVIDKVDNVLLNKLVDIQFPAIINPPVHQPQPIIQVTKLAANQLYVITAEKTQIFVLGSPDNLLTITEEAGPIRVRGVFVDNPSGKAELRLFKQKQVFIVEANGVGNAELLVVKVGTTAAKDVIRVTLSVDNGVPPPNPPDPPKPPTPPIPGPDNILVKAFKAGYDKDTDTDKATSVAKLAVIYQQAAKVTAPDTAFKTVGELDTALRTSTQGAIGVLTIPNTRDAIGVWTKTQLPTPRTTPIDDMLRQRYIATWSAIGNALSELK